MSPRTLVGRGYMPKGGAAAARAHNDRVRRADPRHALPPVADARTCARDSARAARALVTPGAIAAGVMAGTVFAAACRLIP